MQKYDTPNPVAVVLDVPAGVIRLVAGDRADTTVEILPSQASKKRDMKAAEKTSVEFADGVLRITTADPNRVLGGSGSLDVTIALPSGSRFSGRAGAAELHSTGRLGAVAFDGGFQKVTLDEVVGADLSVHTGEVTIARLTGPANIRTGKGDITVAEAVAGEIELRSDMGDLSISAAPGVSATLDAGTAHGRVGNALKNAHGAEAALTIKATTSHGDITAKSL